jgi:protocatechuate 3,4-dioxygenase, beta subunit
MLATILLLSTLTSMMQIAPPAGGGERLVISGTMFLADGRTPARDVVLFAYHTNAKGVYVKRGDTPYGLSGRLKTDANGRYRIETIRPGGYPGRRDPAHIHLVLEPAKTYIDEIVFDDDPRTDSVRGKRGYAIVKVVKRNGVWTGTHNIVLR